MSKKHVAEELERPIKPKAFAEMVGVTVRTLQRWDKKGVLVAHRTPTNRRYYTQQQYEDFKSGKIERGR